MQTGTGAIRCFFYACLHDENENLTKTGMISAKFDTFFLSQGLIFSENHG